MALRAEKGREMEGGSPGGTNAAHTVPAIRQGEGQRGRPWQQLIRLLRRR